MKEQLRIYFLRAKLILNIFIVISIFQNSNAQIINITQYTVKDGLAESNVNAIYQDSLDYIWIATRGGICKFDGHNFRILNVANGLATNYVTSISQDKKGDIWIGTLSGVSKYNGQSVINILDSLSSSGKNIRALIIDHSQYVWIGTYNGVYRINSKTNQILNHFILDSIGIDNNKIRTLFEDKEGNIWTATGNTIYKISPNNNLQVSNYSCTELLTKHIWGITQDCNGTIWIGTEGNGLFFIENNKLTKFDFKRPNINNVWALYTTKNGALLIGTDEGVCKIHEHTTQWINIKNGLSDNLIRSFLEDNEGNIWIGTLNGGVNVLKPTIFKNYLPNDFSINTSVRSISKGPENLIYLGNTTGDILIYKNNQLEKLKYSGYKITKAVSMLKYDSISKTLLIGTYGEGLFKYKNGVITPFLKDKIGNSNIICCSIDDNNILWIGTHDLGLLKIDHNTITQYDKSKGFTNSIRGIIKLSNGELIVGTAIGLAVFKDNSYKIYQINNSTSDNDILSITQNSLNKIFIGTQKDLYEFKNNQFILQPFLGSNLRPFLSLTSYGEKLICGNFSGIHLLDLKTKKSYNYNHKDGFYPIEVGPDCFFKNDTNNIWIASINGLSSFSPKDLTSKTEVLNAYITGIEISNKNISTLENLKYTNFDTIRNLPVNLELEYNQNQISFNFIGINYYSPESISYQYRLIGFETDWQPTTQRTEASYSNLPPGKYIFEIKALTGKINTTEIMAEYTFIIKPPFWEKWWFYLGEFGILFIFLLVSLYLRHKRIYIHISSMILIIFLLILTEILAIYLENYVENYAGGIPILKLILNVGIAISLAPLEKLAKNIF